MVTRRNALRIVGAGLVGISGCASRNLDAMSGGTSTTDPSTATSTTPPPTSTTTEDPSVDVDVTGASPAWNRHLEGPVQSSPAFISGTVVVAAGWSIHGLDAVTGETAWTLDLDASPERERDRLDATLRVGDGRVYGLVGVGSGLSGSGYTLFALSSDGTEQWHYQSGIEKFHDLAAVGEGVALLTTSTDYVGPEGQQAIAVDVQDGTERWRSDTGSASSGVLRDGLATLDVARTVVDCFDVETGERRFRFDPEGGGAATTSTLGGGRAFVTVDANAADAPTLYALDAADGSTDWTGDDVPSATLRYRDDLYVGGAAIRRLGPDGTERWRYDSSGFVAGVPFDEEALYTHTGSRVVAIDREDGTERWATDVPDRTYPTARVDDSVVARAGDAKTVFAWQVGDGSERWRASVPTESGPRPAVGDGRVYVATRAGGLVAVPV